MTKETAASALSDDSAAMRKFDEGGSEAVHGAYWPLSLRQDSGVLASLGIDLNGKHQSFEANVWRISPLGAEFEQTRDMPPLEVGHIIEIKLTFRNQLCHFHGIVVCRMLDNATGRALIGMRWCEDTRENTPRQTRRNLRRWICSTSFLPTAVAPNPILFNDLLLFRVADMSKNGARLVTSMRNKFIVPNMWLDGTFTFPMIGSGSGRFQVKWTDLVSTDGKQELTLGVEFSDLSKEMAKLMGEYVLQFGDNATIAEIRDSGLTVRNTSKAIDVSYARTKKDYEEVLELRRLAYEVYKTDGEIAELSDIYDSRARLVMVRLRGRCVASCRIIFHDVNDQLEQEQYGKMPADMPRNDELVEVTRICTHPDYRASDLTYEMLRQVYVAMIQAKRRYMVGSSPDHLLPFYEKMAGKKLGITYSPKSCPELRLHVIMGDLYNGLKGIGVNPILWGIIGEDLLKLAVEKDFVRIDSLTKIRLAAYRMLKPLGRRMIRAQENKPAKKKKKG